jgi:hypothetical protein
MATADAMPGGFITCRKGVHFEQRRLITARGTSVALMNSAVSEPQVQKDGGVENVEY